MFASFATDGHASGLSTLACIAMTAYTANVARPSSPTRAIRSFGKRVHPHDAVVSRVLMFTPPARRTGGNRLRSSPEVRHVDNAPRRQHERAEGRCPTCSISTTFVRRSPQVRPPALWSAAEGDSLPIAGGQPDQGKHGSRCFDRIGGQSCGTPFGLGRSEWHGPIQATSGRWAVLPARATRAAWTASGSKRYRLPAMRHGTRSAFASSRNQACVTPSRRAIRGSVNNSDTACSPNWRKSRSP